MLQDANLDKFRVQFEKLHNALQDATQSNGRLQVKNREVNAELVANAAKVSRNTIQKLYIYLVTRCWAVTNIDCHQHGSSPTFVTDISLLLLMIFSDGSIIETKSR